MTQGRGQICTLSIATVQILLIRNRTVEHFSVSHPSCYGWHSSTRGPLLGSLGRRSHAPPTPRKSLQRTSSGTLRLAVYADRKVDNRTVDVILVQTMSKASCSLIVQVKPSRFALLPSLQKPCFGPEQNPGQPSLIVPCPPRGLLYGHCHTQELEIGL